MNREKCFVIGISGTTCSGKSTLAAEIQKNLKDSVVIHQDNYFLPEDDPRHIRVPELNHCNWELLSCVDMKKMFEDITKLMITEQSSDAGKEIKPRVIVLDGFLLYEYKKIADLCDLKFYLTLDKKECKKRREGRTYDPPDVPGYFEAVVWPEYLKQQQRLKNNKELCETIIFIDGLKRRDDIFKIVFAEIEKVLA